VLGVTVSRDRRVGRKASKSNGSGGAGGRERERERERERGPENNADFRQRRTCFGSDKDESSRVESLCQYKLTESCSAKEVSGVTALEESVGKSKKTRMLRNNSINLIKLVNERIIKATTVRAVVWENGRLWSAASVEYNLSVCRRWQMERTNERAVEGAREWL
jgi:hypothetical protein